MFEISFRTKQQVCRLELAKKLKKLGMKQESLFWWAEYNDGTSSLIDYKAANKHCRSVLFNLYSAPTVAELGEMLPYYIKTSKAYIFLVIKKLPTGWECGYAEIDYTTHFRRTGETLADACGEILVYLWDNNLIQKEV